MTEPGSGHWGFDPTFGFPARHRGLVNNCGAPECVEKQPVAIPDGWGMYCPHGAHIVVLDRIENREPIGRVVEPWPCDLCTREEFEAEMDRELEESLEALRSLFRQE